MSFKTYINDYLVVTYIKDILPEALEEDINLVLTICKNNLKKYEETINKDDYDGVRNTNYSISKINQALYFNLNIMARIYPQYNENFNRLIKLMKTKIIAEKKAGLKR